MEIGKLNQRIAVLENHVKKDGIGNHKAQWEEAFSLWASVSVGNSVTSATEETAAGVTKEVQKLEVIIRQTPQTKRLTATAHRISFDGIEYNITGVIPSYTSQDYMKLLCESRRAGARDDIY